MDYTAERGFLGSVLLDNSLISRTDLSSDDFLNGKNARLFEIFKELYEEKTPVSLETVITYIKSHPKDNGFFGNECVSIMTQIQSSTISANEAEYFANTIRKETRRRKLDNLFAQYRAEVKDSDNPEEITSRAMMELAKLQETQKVNELLTPKQRAESLFDLINKEMSGEVDMGAITGFADLDEQIGSFKKGEIAVLAARPSMGKTALALSIACNNAIMKQYSIMIASIEMSVESIDKRLLARFSGVNLKDLMNPQRMKDDEKKIMGMIRGLDILSQCKIHVFHENLHTVSSIAKVARSLKFKSGLDFIVIDHLQLMDDSDLSEKFRNTNVTRMTRYIMQGLRRIGTELQVPILILSQLSRSVESRNGGEKIPQLSDLRDSGTIEEDADVVMMMYRPAYYAKSEAERKADNRTIISIAKNRNSPQSFVTLAFIPEIASFKGFSTQEE